MRYYKAAITTKDPEVNFREVENLPILFEQVDKRAVIFADAAYPHYSPLRRKKTNNCETFNSYLLTRNLKMSISDIDEMVRTACDIWEIDHVTHVDIQEASFADDIPFDNNIRFGSQSTVLPKGNLFELHSFVRSKRIFKDWIVAARPWKVCEARAGKTSSSKALAQELTRMHASSTSDSFDLSIPVHYMVEGLGRSEHEDTLNVLLESLYAAHRLPSPHAFMVDFDRFHHEECYRFFHEREPKEALNDAFGFALAGNVVIAQYGLNDDDSSYDLTTYENFCQFLDVIKPHLDNTLLVLSVPARKPELKQRLRRLLQLPLVDISLDEAPNAHLMKRSEAMAFLLNHAQSMGMTTDEMLIKMLDERMQDASFTDLKGLFDDWRRIKMVKERYPAYTPEMDQMFDLRQMHLPSAMEQLDELIGLDEVKRQIKEILMRFNMQRDAQKKGLPLRPFCMHLAFLGAPGTGKTEVARLYGQILKEAGVLSCGRVISVSGCELGKPSISKLFELARGSVLFIDEAYGISNPDIITDLIAHMENSRHETVVILAGYKGHMNALLDRNPGFRSRLGFTLHFPEYSCEEMLSIFELMCKRHKVRMTHDAKRTTRDLLMRNGRRADQGNARYVRKLFEDCLGAQEVRLSQLHEAGHDLTASDLEVLENEDVCKAGSIDQNTSQITGRDQLQQLIGLKSIKALVNQRIDFLKLQKMRRDAGISAPTAPMHMAFLGAPGTGKTHVARLIGTILREEGVLSVGDFYELSGSSLISAIPDKSSAIIKELFQKARGSVVFIDEAYALCHHDGATACTELIAQMEEYRDEVVVIFAGYENEIKCLLQSNPGFASRVNFNVSFPNYSEDEMVEIFSYMAHDKELALADGVLERVRTAVQLTMDQKDYGNARFARNLLDKTLLRQSQRLAQEMTEQNITTLSVEELTLIQPQDVPDDMHKEGMGSKKRCVGFV